MKNPLWNFDRRQRVYLTLTPAHDQAKVLVSIYVGHDSRELDEAMRWVWSWEQKVDLYNDVMKFAQDHLASAVEELLQIQTLMDGAPEQLDGLGDRTL